MTTTRDKMPARPPLDDFSDTQQSDHYNDIKSATLSYGRSNKTRQKAARDRERQSSIWAVAETEKQNKKTKSKQIKSKKTENERPSPPPPPPQQQKQPEERKTFLENPIYENELKNWTLPRVELWCRDPSCHYNLHLYNHRHQASGAVVVQEIADVDHHYYHQQERQSTGSRLSSAYHSHSRHNQTPLDHEISINSVPMVLNSHHSSKIPHAHGNIHMNMNMGMGINNLNTNDGSFAKADNNFSNSTTDIPSGANNALTMTHTDTMASSITTHSSTKTNNTDSTILTINTNHHGEGSTASTDVSSGSTFATGFDSAGSSSSKQVGHDIVDYNKTSSRNGPSVYQTASSGSGYLSSLPYSQGYRPPTSSSTNPYCPNCSGIVPTNHMDPISDVSRLKAEPGLFWNFNKFQHPLQRDHSFHSVGGFTLNGQYNTNVKKHTMLKFCSSHKISLVVSTFSLLVTIGLLITLFLMKKRGMMDTMDS